jgi:hypothetical protein
MLNNHTQEIRECCQQAAHCVQQAEEAQNDPKVQRQYLELARRWLLLARGLTDLAVTPPRATTATTMTTGPAMS